MDGNLITRSTDPRVNVNVTCGDFASEEAAQAWLLGFLKSCRDKDGEPFFKYVREFRPGVPLFRHHRQSIDKRGYKCDIIALPTKPGISSMFGAIVFEVKSSGVEIGPGINQLKDYMASTFDVSGIKVVPSFGFLFPCHKQCRATASWMAHQSIGSVSQVEYGRVRFYSGEERLLEFDQLGAYRWATKGPRSGRGSGSR